MPSLSSPEAESVLWQSGMASAVMADALAAGVAAI